MGKEDIAEIMPPLDDSQVRKELPLKGPGNDGFNGAESQHGTFHRWGLKVAFGGEAGANRCQQIGIHVVSHLLRAPDDEIERTGSLRAEFITGKTGDALFQPVNGFPFHQFLELTGALLLIKVNILAFRKTVPTEITPGFYKHTFPPQGAFFS
jgi:hypothetical protein